MKIYSSSKTGDIREILLPCPCPEQIIFERRNDGFYNMTTKIYTIDPDDKTKTKIAYEKCVVKLPKWVGGIPIRVRQQEGNILYTIEFLDDVNKHRMSDNG